MEIKDLGLLNEHINKFSALLEQEYAKGKAANTDKIFEMISAITTCYHANNAATHRQSEKKREAWMDKTHPVLVNLNKNATGHYLNSTAGALLTTGAVFTLTVVIRGYLTNVPVADIERLLKIPTGFIQGTSSGLSQLAQAATSYDQARPMAMKFAMDKEQTNRNDDQNLQQSATSQSQEALRKQKELIDNDASNKAAVLRALSGQ